MLRTTAISRHSLFFSPSKQAIPDNRWTHRFGIIVPCYWPSVLLSLHVKTEPERKKDGFAHACSNGLCVRNHGPNKRRYWRRELGVFVSGIAGPERESTAIRQPMDTSYWYIAPLFCPSVLWLRGKKWSQKNKIIPTGWTCLRFSSYDSIVSKIRRHARPSGGALVCKGSSRNVLGRYIAIHFSLVNELIVKVPSASWHPRSECACLSSYPCRWKRIENETTPAAPIPRPPNETATFPFRLCPAPPLSNPNKKKHRQCSSRRILCPCPNKNKTQTISLEISNPFEASAKTPADGRFTVRLTQAMLSEHPAVANLALPGGGGRRASLAARRRASSVLLSSLPSSAIASKTSVASGEGVGGAKKGRDGGGAAKAGVGDDGAKVCGEGTLTDLLHRWSRPTVGVAVV